MFQRILAAMLTAVSITATTTAAFYTYQATATCTRYCDPAKSKPCGKSCISKYFTCRTPWTTACSGKRTSADEPGYDNPKKIEPSDIPKAGEKQPDGASWIRQWTDHARKRAS